MHLFIRFFIISAVTLICNNFPFPISIFSQLYFSEAITFEVEIILFCAKNCIY